MKCLQCGTELDRLAKWRGPSEYCSDECKKASQDEFNQLAMNRLMQPRPAPTSARVAAGAVRTVEGGAGRRLTVVTHPVGASSPMLTEPPEAGFIMEAAATLADLQLRHQPPANPRPLQPIIPSSAFPLGDALLALESMLSGIRPTSRPARKLNPASRHGFAQLQSATPEFELPACEPVWFASLGLTFKVAGIDSGSTTVSTAPAAGAPAQAMVPAGYVETRPVAHRAIPSRRAARAFPSMTDFELGTERLMPPPVVSPPRLRIHLPKPALNPFRPRYAFAPAPVEEQAAEETVEIPVEVEIAVEAEETAAPAPIPAAVEKAVENPVEKPIDNRQQRGAADREDRKKQRGKHGRSGNDFNERREPAVETNKPEPKPEPRPIQREEAEKRKPVEKAVVEKPAPAETFAVPSFGGQTDPEPEGFWSRMPGWQKAAALVIIGVAVGAWAVPALNSRNTRTVTLPSAAGPAPALSSMGAESWETASAGDTAGIARRRVISHYKPAASKRDYIFEFTGQIEQRSMGWVFRMKDARNYYCLKLEKKGDGPAATAQLVKFAVVNGEEQAHRLVQLRDPVAPGMPLKIRLDVRGQSFSTQINGKHVDVWIDSQLASGSVGFSNESGERAVIRTVKVSY